MGYVEKWFGKPILEEVTESDILQFSSRQIHENLSLEYKSIKSLGRPEILRKAIAAFANSDGGLLIVGIEEVERGTGTLPWEIEWNNNPKRNKEWFQNSTVNQIKPNIAGIRIAAVTNSSGENVFLVDVPASQNPPHMADGRYYFRHNFESLQMEHYQVADAFGRRKRPILKPFLEVSSYNSVEHTADIAYSVGNQGHAIAKWVMVYLVVSRSSKVESAADYGEIWQTIYSDNPGRGNTRWRVNYERPTMVLHVGMMKSCGRIKVRLGDSPSIIKIIIGAEDSSTDEYATILSEKWIASEALKPDYAENAHIPVPLIGCGMLFTMNDLMKWSEMFSEGTRESIESMTQEDRDAFLKEVLDTTGLGDVVSAIETMAHENEGDDRTPSE